MQIYSVFLWILTMCFSIFSWLCFFFSLRSAFPLEAFLFLFSLFFHLSASCFARFGSNLANNSISNNLFPFFAFLTYLLFATSIFRFYSHFRSVGLRSLLYTVCFFNYSSFSCMQLLVYSLRLLSKQFSRYL